MEIHKFFTYVFSLYSATDAYPFCVCKNKAEEKLLIEGRVIEVEKLYVF